MCRLALAGTLLLLMQLTSASAQEWAEKMFQTTEHDFGAVARAAKVEFPFVLKNIYKEDIHIAGVRSSCGCTLPRIGKDTLKTYEQGSIIAAFNTRSFTGQRSARVTVTIDRPAYAEVQLQVRGYIRTDIVLDPEQVVLGTVDQGSRAEKKVRIEYAGRPDWKILEARPGSRFLDARVREVARGSGRVSYELAVRVREDAPTGYLKDQLMLVTNDLRATQFPVTVEGLVVSDLAISPSSIMLGILQPGQKVTKQIVIKAKTPFRILDIECADQSFSFKTSEDAQLLHIIPVMFEASDNPGRISERIRLRTDLPDHEVAEITAFGQISSPLAGN